MQYNGIAQAGTDADKHTVAKLPSLNPADTILIWFVSLLINT